MTAQQAAGGHPYNARLGSDVEEQGGQEPGETAHPGDQYGDDRSAEQAVIRRRHA